MLQEGYETGARAAGSGSFRVCCQAGRGAKSQQRAAGAAGWLQGGPVCDVVTFVTSRLRAAGPARCGTVLGQRRGRCREEGRETIARFVLHAGGPAATAACSGQSPWERNAAGDAGAAGPRQRPAGGGEGARTGGPAGGAAITPAPRGEAARGSTGGRRGAGR